MAKKKERKPDQVAKRVAAMRKVTPTADHGEGVTPLAIGYFELQRMREHTSPKLRAKQERRTLHKDR